MIIANGTIEAKYVRPNPADKDGDGLDDITGYPIEATEEDISWGGPVPCQYRANRYSKLGKANGEAFTIASYEILIEEQPCEAGTLRLRDAEGRVLGEFSVIEIEPLRAVSQLRILV